MTTQLKTKANKVQEALTQKGYAFVVKQLPNSTRSAQEAANAIGCQVAEIAKSIVFKDEETEQPILVIASGANRIDIKKIEILAGSKLTMPDGKWVKKTLGYAIGGIPPIGHYVPMKVFIDKALLEFDTIWAAAGTPHAVFSLPSQDLPGLSGGSVIDV